MPMPDDVAKAMDEILLQFGDLLLERRLGDREVADALTRVRQTILHEWAREERRQRDFAFGRVAQHL